MSGLLYAYACEKELTSLCGERTREACYSGNVNTISSCAPAVSCPNPMHRLHYLSRRLCRPPDWAKQMLCTLPGRLKLSMSVWWNSPAPSGLF